MTESQGAEVIALLTTMSENQAWLVWLAESQTYGTWFLCGLLVWQIAAYAKGLEWPV